MKYVFDPVSGRLTAIEDKNGNTQTISYNADNQMERVTDNASGRQMIFSYTEEKRIDSISGPVTAAVSDGIWVSYTYDGIGNLTGVHYADDGNGSAASGFDCRYDDTPDPHNMTAKYDIEGHLLSSWSYNADDQAVSSSTRDGKGALINYEDNENPTRIIYRKIEQGYTHDADGNAVPYEYITSFQRNDKGQIVSFDGPLPGDSDIIGFTYDELTGDLLTVSRPLSGTTELQYDPAGNVTQIEDPNAVEAILAYDGRNRMLSAEIGGKTESLVYTAAGKIKSKTDRSGLTFNYTYDSKGFLKSILSPSGEYISFIYDANGNCIEETVHKENGTRTRYRGWDFGDPAANPELSAGMPWKILKKNQEDTGTLETVLSYSNGQVSQIIDPEDSWKKFDYDVFGRVIRAEEQISDIRTSVTEFAYDIRGNLIRVTDANGNDTRYIFDDAGRMIQKLSPDTGMTRYTYDAAGNLASRTLNDGTATAYTYDAQSRLVSVSHENQENMIFLSYDQGENGMGRLTAVTDASGTCSYKYDRLGRVIKQEMRLDGIDYITSYAYDENGNVTSVVYPSGREVKYERDAASRISQVASRLNEIKPVAENITWQPFSGIESLNYGNGTSLEKKFDPDDLISNVSAGGVFEERYERDGAGNVTRIHDLIGSTDLDLTYNRLYQLAEAAGSSDVYQYEYDLTGNRQTRTWNSKTDVYDYLDGTSRLVQINGTDITSTPNGSLETAGSRRYEYDPDNRLGKAVENDTVLAEYAYNSFGLRTMKKTDAQTLFYHYDLEGKLMSESSQDGIVIKDYVWLDHQPLAQILPPDQDTIEADIDKDGDIDGKDLATSLAAGPETAAAVFGRQYDPEGSIYYYHNDHLGTPKTLTDESGSAVWQADYTPFGTARIVVCAIENNLRFPGQYYDAETGLHHNWHRYYDPDTGRYLTPDPIGLAGGINPYVYADNNPVNYMDPKGLFVHSLISGVTAGGVVGGITLVTEIAKGTQLDNAAQKAFMSGVTSGVGVGLATSGIGFIVANSIASVADATLQAIFYGNIDTISALSSFVTTAGGFASGSAFKILSNKSIQGAFLFGFASGFIASPLSVGGNAVPPCK